jgi:hypothetical protein
VQKYFQIILKFESIYMISNMILRSREKLIFFQGAVSFLKAIYFKK